MGVRYIGEYRVELLDTELLEQFPVVGDARRSPRVEGDVVGPCCASVREEVLAERRGVTLGSVVVAGHFISESGGFAQKGFACPGTGVTE